ncbi:MAG: PQQ-binding-like beta-propeller repeat protein [Cyclobacteriaceae bacterium]|nr:PQQ-binding-like beta-propeller repeat protein [Cyclobacteriaceae bacterium]
MKKLYTFPVLVALLLLTGCFHIKQIFTINPDGSGKVLMEAVFNISEGADNQSAIEKARKSIRDVFEESQGIETWSGLEYSLDEDGLVTMIVTGYFSDINLVKIHNLSTPETIIYSNNLLSIQPFIGKKQSVKTELSQEEIKKRAIQEQESFQKEGDMILPFFKDMSSEKSFNVSGNIVNGKAAFTTSKEGYPTLSFDGNDFAFAFEELSKQSMFWEDQAKLNAGMIDTPSQVWLSQFIEKTYGVKEVPSIKINSDKPLFDYQNEVLAAKQSFQKMLENNGIDPIIPEVKESLWNINTRFNKAYVYYSDVLIAQEKGGENVLEYYNGKNGELKWSHPLDMSTYGYNYLLSGSDAGIIASDKEGTIFSLSVDKGNELWKVENVPESFAPFSYSVSENKIYAGKSGVSFMKIDLTTGNVEWKKENTGPNGTPFVTTDKVFCELKEGFDRNLCALNLSTGEDLWKRKTVSPVVFIESGSYSFTKTVYPNAKKEKKKKGGKNVSVTIDNLIYAVRDSIVVLNTESGNVSWSKHVASGNLNWSKVFVFGDMVVVDEQGGLIAYSLKDGSEKWKFRDPNELRQPSFKFYSKCIMEGDAIYYEGDSGYLFVLNKNSGDLLWSKKITERGFYSKPYISGNKLYLGSSDNFIYQIDIQTKTPELKYKGGTVIGEYGGVLFIEDAFKGLNVFGKQ